ncbi:formate dehydrogenase accessory protein FdhE [Desulfovibrio ferrophilus]|uniref:Formate dehydrogenase accessory protein n=1 Tax=Desulfovibrio ferrophilus TaxID=241368 RepID=A0A2Z6AVV4_9BACT|nr:formate dehydrogenase accessory protein FdhE [Desulfovibrio ferrophilus]BBD07361.1 formate dehydrogenase accessory protein [Desulfovibrio ferrophilus]
MSFSADLDLKRLSKRIETLKKRGDIPNDLLELVDAVFRRQLIARGEAKVNAPSEEQLTSEGQHAQGAPLVEREQFPYDRIQAEALFKEFLALITVREDGLGKAGQLIEQDLNSDNLDLDIAFAAHLSGDESYFEAMAEKTPEAPRTLPFLVQASLSPSIGAAAALLDDKHDSQMVWSHGHCPICASLPLMGELREKSGFRYVNCSFCSTSYRVPRMACAFCGETDAQKLAYFSADDETGYRVEVCESCKMYIKSADFRELDKAALPLIDDLESLSLDILAGNEGYSRPTLSGLGF